MKDTQTQQGKNYQFDVLVLGTGLAGLHYCLQLLALQPHLKIALISKAEAIECNSRYAQGGIAAAVSPED
ncbi:MAG: FAD-binding protein, partial [Legionella sp.]